MIRGILAAIGAIALVLFIAAQCGVPIPGTRPIVAPAPGGGGVVAPPARLQPDQPAQAPAQAQTQQGAPADAQANTNYVGIAPDNAPKAAAVDIGFVSIRQIGIDQDPVMYTYTGGASRWFAMRQTGVNTAKTFEIACSTKEWVWFVDAVSATFGGRSLFSQEPRVVIVDRCPFEVTSVYLFTGQVGAVKRSDIPYAIRDRNEGFQRASGHPAQFSSWDGSKLVPMQLQ